MTKSRRLQIFDILIITITILGILFNSSIECSKLLSMYILGINAIALYRGKKNWNTIICFALLLWFNYSFFAANLYWPIQNFFTGWKNTVNIMVMSVNILLVFTTVLTLALPKSIENSVRNFFEETSKRHNSLIVIGISILLMLILIYGFSRPSIAGQRGTSSSMYEYAIILFIVAFMYSQSKFSRIIISLIAILYILQDLIFGGRVTALQLLIMLFLIILSYRAKVKDMLPFLIVGLIIFSGIGAFRAGFVLNTDSISNVWKQLFNSKFVLDTSYSAFYTSGTFIMAEDVCSTFLRFKMFLKFLLSILLGSSVPDSNLAIYTRSMWVHYYGGVLPFFGHFYLGYFGVIIVAILIAYFIRKLVINPKQTFFCDCLCIYFIATTPRWYLYSPTPLLRGVLFFSLFYFVCYQFDRVCKKS